MLDISWYLYDEYFSETFKHEKINEYAIAKYLWWVARPETINIVTWFLQFIISARPDQSLINLFLPENQNSLVLQIINLNCYMILKSHKFWKSWLIFIVTWLSKCISSETPNKSLAKPDSQNWVVLQDLTNLFFYLIIKIH